MYDLSTKKDEANVIRNDDNTDFVVDLTSGKRSYSSLATTTQEEKAIAFNAMNSPQHRVSDMINKTISLKDIYVETVNCIDKNGVIAICPRIVLVDVNGEAYACVSVGMFGSLSKLIQVYGEPTWTEGINVEITQSKTKTGNSVLGLRIV